MIVVTGVGRSGTSVVARTLHEELGVPMGLPSSLETEGSRAVPEGSYEDEEIRDLHARARRSDELRVRLRNRIVDELARRRDALGTPFGVKDPRILDFPEAWETVLGSASLVVCRRDLDSVLESWTRVTASDRPTAERRVRERLSALDRILAEADPREVLELDFSEWREPEAIADALRALEEIG